MMIDQCQIEIYNVQSTIIFKIMKQIKLLTYLLTLTFFIGCTDDDDTLPVVPTPDPVIPTPDPDPLGEYQNGLLLLNEGNFLSANSSVSFLSDEDQLTNGIFTTVNSSVLGDVAQSIGFTTTDAYICVNNSAKVEVVNRYTFESLATITEGINSPRYFIEANDLGYISDWGDPNDAADDFVAVINLETREVASTIAVNEGPERLLVVDNKLFVSHKGGYDLNGPGSSVSVIDLTTNTVTSIATMENPDDLVLDVSGNVWVLTEGSTIYDIDWNVIGSNPGSLTKINATTNAVEETIEMPNDAQPSHLVLNNDTLYFNIGTDLYATTTSVTSNDAATILDAPIISFNNSIYGFNIVDSRLFVMETNFTSNATMLEYSIADLTSNPISRTVGVGASKIYKNE